MYPKRGNRGAPLVGCGVLFKSWACASSIVTVGIIGISPILPDLFVEAACRMCFQSSAQYVLASCDGHEFRERGDTQEKLGDSGCQNIEDISFEQLFHTDKAYNLCRKFGVAPKTC